MLPKGGGPRAQKAAGTLSNEPSWNLEVAWGPGHRRVSSQEREPHRDRSGAWGGGRETVRLAPRWLLLHRRENVSVAVLWPQRGWGVDTCRARAVRMPSRLESPPARALGAGSVMGTRSPVGKTEPSREHGPKAIQQTRMCRAAAEDPLRTSHRAEAKKEN